MKRSRLEIVIDILKVCGEETKKTRIIYRTNLNYQLTEKYLALLLENRWVERIENEYKITCKGKEFLSKAKEVSLPFELT
ncbi:MAG: hypothetical protein OIN66_09875 [Candidatus Methanoperedens sp.]|nr:hypothetical protein [Candidatus Methanoperedens sp.]